MLFIVQFEDKPDAAEKRQELFASHKEFLDRNKDKVLVPGSLREIPSDRPLGGLWIVLGIEAVAGGDEQHDSEGDEPGAPACDDGFAAHGSLCDKSTVKSSR